jgi:hypothetical protein
MKTTIEQIFPDMEMKVQEAPLSGEDKAVLQQKLFPLLERQFRLKTQGDRTSLREEEAAELLDSIFFTLQFETSRRGLPLRTLLTADLAPLFSAAQQSLQQCLTHTEQLYRRVMAEANDFGSISLRDTLNGIDMFFRKYDYRLDAHLIPANIDYQLCLPVPDELRGVVFIREYLLRLLTENTLLTRYSPSRVAALLTRFSPDYRGLLVNLYEPVAAVTVGHALSGGGETLLELTGTQSAQIAQRLFSLSPAGAKHLLAASAREACEHLALTDPLSVRYLVRTAVELYPRLTAGPQSAAGVFSAVGKA